MAKSNPDYRMLAEQIQALVANQPHWVVALSNASAHLMSELDDLNWAGFYLRGSYVDPSLPDDVLVLGPFQGNVACTTIAWNKGVCGTAAAANATQRVEDVHAFPGHIACDAASASELVVPLRKEGAVVGVLDMDSPHPARFSPADQAGLELAARAIEAAL